MGVVSIEKHYGNDGSINQLLVVGAVVVCLFGLMYYREAWWIIT